MDPNATLKKIRELAQRLLWDTESPAGELAERIEALDTWICKGGFLPTDWENHTNRKV